MRVWNSRRSYIPYAWENTHFYSIFGTQLGIDLNFHLYHNLQAGSLASRSIPQRMPALWYVDNIHSNTNTNTDTDTDINDCR